MAFFDNIGKKATAATSKAVQMAQDLSESTRLSGLITEQERRIEAVYHEIGRKYVELHTADAEDAFSGYFAALKDATDKIAEYQNQILTIKGRNRCPICGAEVPKEAAFCSACGAAIPKAAVPVAKNICVQCGHPLEPGMRFCTACGTPVPAADSMNQDTIFTPAESPVIPVAEVESAPYMAGTNSPTRYCVNCGAALSAGEMFCTECGMRQNG